MILTTAGVLAWVTTLLASVVGGGSGMSQPRAAQQQRPNVLIFITDDQRAEGTMDVLPAVQKWFGEQGTEFTNAYATTPLCCPARASILTGRYAHNHTVYENGRDAIKRLKFGRTLPAVLQHAGYRTGIFGKYFNQWPHDRRPPHFDEWVVSSFGYEDSTFNIQGGDQVVPGYSMHFVSDKATEFVEQASSEPEPWFAYIAPVAAHTPFTPEPAYAEAPVPPREHDPSEGEEDLSDKPPWVRAHRLLPTEIADERAAGQLRTLMTVNDMVDRVMTTLHAAGEADNTLAIFTSDHGFLWGEHGLGNKRQPYTPSIEVPLYARWPGTVTAGAQDDRIAANVDIMPTILDAVGVERERPLDGLSLLQDHERDALFLEYRSAFGRPGRLPSWASVLTRRDQYIEYYSRSGARVFREYYDLLRDPAQLVNLLHDGDELNDPPAPLLKSLENAVDEGRQCRGRSCTMRAIPKA